MFWQQDDVALCRSCTPLMLRLQVATAQGPGLDPAASTPQNIAEAAVSSAQVGVEAKPLSVEASATSEQQLGRRTSRATSDNGSDGGMSDGGHSCVSGGDAGSRSGG